jgi:putative transposase
MREMNLISKQPGSRVYNKATLVRPDIPNVLDLGLAWRPPKKVWCGDINTIGPKVDVTIWHQSSIFIRAGS